MLLADTMAIFFVIVGLIITFPSLWLLCAALWPAFLERSCRAVEGGIWKSFFLGIPVAFVSVLIVVIVGKLPASFGQIGGILSFSILMLFAQVGVAGLACSIGSRLFSAGAGQPAWKATMRGGAVLVLSWLLPLVGWFLILPASIIIGAGTSLRACFSGKKQKKSVLSQSQDRESSAALPSTEIAESSADHIGTGA